MVIVPPRRQARERDGFCRSRAGPLQRHIGLRRAATLRPRNRLLRLGDGALLEWT